MRNPFTRYLFGEGPLWKVFWLYGVVPSNLLLATILVMLKSDSRNSVLYALLAVLVIYTAWIVTAVWRCADNVRTVQYGIIARWLTVAWAINTLFFTLFVGLDLAA